MEDTRHAIRQGRVLADEGLYEHAMETWKAALSGAYALQDYAGMFVLSGNIGEACVRIAMQSEESSRASKLLHEAVENLDYALQIVEQCSLRDVLGGYRVLYQGVRRAEMLKVKAQKLINKLQVVEEEVEAKREVLPCTTCGGVGEEIVLDENDGCYYCKRCYDEYYAAKDDVSAPVDLAIGKEKKVDTCGLDVDDRATDTQWAAQLDYQDSGNDAMPTDEQVEAIEVAPIRKDKQIDEVAKETSEEITQRVIEGNNAEKLTQDRVRYERVELGSLADFLAGKLHLENEPQQLETQRNSGSKDAGVFSTKATDGCGQEEISEEPVANTKDQSDGTANPAELDEDGACVEEAPALSETEDTAENIPDKLEYSIAQLLEIRKISPSDCPETLLVSPVRDDGTASTPARNKPNNSRKKSNAKKTSRSVTSHRESNADPSHFSQAATSEKPTISPLPTLELCAAMRKGLQEHQERQADSGAICDNSMAPGSTEVLMTAVALLNGPDSGVSVP
ncbi:hypothetical protein F442_19328 [Phytophthora nicotianae P10297]|uniref:Uncharacterized protein n=1 Tax=Phytophthora nicotianae P10297 TaxID=1317064 RepID=W2YCB2_PHYNI|nr:hypothetical protein F442_19328 [Phytophthora nicotianae P10297]